MAGTLSRAAIEAEILARTGATAKSICPSEVARGLAPDRWRPLMGRVREAAAGLARDGRVVILRKGRPVAPEDLRGVIRLRRPGGEAGEETTE